MADSSPVDQVRAGIDIVDLVSQYLTLRKAGRTFKGLCPFHTEKTPSFVVFPDTGHWHCFGCGEGGDVFTFLMKAENLSFADALRQLADRVGVVLTRRIETDDQKQMRERLHAANEAAAVYYHGILVNSSSGRAYVSSRGISEGTLREFLIGLAPDGPDALKRHLGGQGFTQDELLTAGLLYQQDGGRVRDRYWGRLMFPIRDDKGRVVSFGGRVLSPEAQPKYLNGPQTDLFDKGATLYGLFGAQESIKRERRAVVVEGYVDVVIAHQEGFRNVVATLGTAITERHLRQLGRLAPEICLALDPDAAGEAAALRTADAAHTGLTNAAVPVPLASGLVRYATTARTAVTVAVLPDGLDPDELVLKDPQRWRETIDSARPLIDHTIGWVASRRALDTAADKTQAAQQLMPLLRDIPDPIQRGHYVELVAQLLRLDSSFILDQLHQRPTRPRLQAVHPEAAASSAPPQAQRASDQDYALSLLVESVQRGLPRPDFDTRDFTDPTARALLHRIQEVLEADPGDWRPDLLTLATEPWLEGSLERVAACLPGVGRLADRQVLDGVRSMARQLREARLAGELRELVAMAQDGLPAEEARRVTVRIGEIGRERASIDRENQHEPRGPSAIGRRSALVPARFLWSSGRHAGGASSANPELNGPAEEPEP